MWIIQAGRGKSGELYETTRVMYGQGWSVGSAFVTWRLEFMVVTNRMSELSGRNLRSSLAHF